ncbi:MAG: tetratricopeptide repeat protein, partial [Planctomycetota bacterium]
MNTRWRVAAELARKRIADVAKIARERKKDWQEMKAIDDANEAQGENRPRMALVNPNGKPQLFNETELSFIRKLRAVARGKPQTLDFLAATIAAGRRDFELALEHLEKAELTESPNPGFQFHVGNIYLGLNRLEDAERAYQRGLHFDEFHPNSLMGLCRTFIEKGNAKKAAEFGTQAVGLKYQFPLGHFFLGKAQQILGQNDAAIHSIKTAIDQNPNFEEAHRLLAKIYGQFETDAELAKQHLSLAENIAKENTTETSADGQMIFPEVDSDTIENELPVVDEDPNIKEGFEKCLGHPKKTEIAFDKEERVPEETVCIVSGLPRSGTSMMMQMLVAGGISPFTDEQREADENNPKGYYEAELVKKLNSDNAWVEECRGKVVKVVAPLIPYLPQKLGYKVIMMDREIEEIMSSQTSMLKRMDRAGANLSDERLSDLFINQRIHAKNLLDYFNHPILEISYTDVLENHKEVAARIQEFLGVDLDLAA